MGRLEKRFQAVLGQASRALPWLAPVVPVWCPQADREHASSWRQFSHACHVPGAVCWARAAEHELTDAEIDGIAAHELGHLVADALDLPAHKRTRRTGRRTQEAEDEANLATTIFGYRVGYNSRTLEEVVSVNPRRRPGMEIHRCPGCGRKALLPSGKKHWCRCHPATFVMAPESITRVVQGVLGSFFRRPKKR